MLATELELAGRIDEAVGVLTKALSAVPSMHDVRRRIQRLLQESNRPRHAPGVLKPFQAKHLAFVGPKGARAFSSLQPFYVLHARTNGVLGAWHAKNSRAVA